MKQREKMPKNLELRRKLMRHLIIDEQENRDYVLALLGYAKSSLSEVIQHNLDQHPFYLPEVIAIKKLFDNDEYRRQQVKRYLEKYNLIIQG